MTDTKRNQRIVDLVDAPVSDNPSGMYCPACRDCGLRHCSQPEYCGGMRLMKPPTATEESP